MVQIVVIWGLTAITAAVIGGLLAGFKKRDYSFWMAWSFMFPPSVLLLLVLPPLHRRPRRPTLDDEDAAEV
ncbi:MAG: hypothetical protein KJZ80_14185 [Hyphomicrobiaceae bacterium]|nr:hypothetical protein [Hyphomicrobiaceae bacterium]